MPRKQVPDKESLKPPVFIELESPGEVARLACAMERAPLPVFATQHDSQFMISTQLDLFAGAPVFYYAYSKETKQYLGYRTNTTGEEISLVDMASNPSFVYAPLIEVTRFPRIFEKGLEGSSYSGPKYLSLQVKDLMSLVKVATYKIMFEEPPLPIFAFPSEKKNKWYLGTFTRIEEFEEASIFFFCERDSRPEENYVGYSTASARAYLTNRTDEHGNFYVKIIRLKQPHPLVETS